MTIYAQLSFSHDEQDFQPNEVDCKRCHGTGEDKDGADCLHCEGNGTLEVPVCG